MSTIPPQRLITYLYAIPNNLARFLTALSLTLYILPNLVNGIFSTFIKCSNSSLLGLNFRVSIALSFADCIDISCECKNLISVLYEHLYFNAILSNDSFSISDFSISICCSSLETCPLILFFSLVHARLEFDRIHFLSSGDLKLSIKVRLNSAPIANI